MGRAFIGGQKRARYKSFANATWAEIDRVAQAGKANQVYLIGDEKQVTLTTGEAITLRIEDFNHDDLASGGKAAITIAMKNLLADTYRMNSSSTNVGGWGGSLMRTSTMPLLLSQMPSDLQSVIKPVAKKTTAGNKLTSVQSTTDRLWLFSPKEMGLQANVAGYMDEGYAYPTYASNTHRVKNRSDGSGSAWNYWTRSPNIEADYTFAYINSSGGFSSSSAVLTQGLCFGFCI